MQTVQVSLDTRDTSGLIQIDEAFRLIMNHGVAVDSCSVPLLKSLGRVLAEDQLATFDLPPHNHAAMDGYTFCFQKGQQGDLKACGFLPAGVRYQQVVPPGEAIRIMTGAPVPLGCDTVVPFENLVVENNRITFLKSFSAGDNIRLKGEDIRQGEPVLKAGTLLRPQEIALLSALNNTHIPVCGRVRVAILATGDELLEPGSDLAPGMIINSNSNSLAAMVLDAGAVPVLKGISNDTLDATTAKIEACLDADVVMVTGGASAGDHDYVRAAIEKLGGEILFSGVRIKPGKPFGFGVLMGKPVFILPGNPVAAMVIFELFVRPLLLAAMGFESIFRASVSAVLVERCKNRGGRPHFVGGKLVMAGNSYQATITGSQSSGRIASLSQANSLLCLAPETVYQPGDNVTALLMDSTLGMHNMMVNSAGFPFKQ